MLLNDKYGLFSKASTEVDQNAILGFGSNISSEVDQILPFGTFGTKERSWPKCHFGGSWIKRFNRSGPQCHLGILVKSLIRSQPKMSLRAFGLKVTLGVDQSAIWRFLGQTSHQELVKNVIWFRATRSKVTSGKDWSGIWVFLGQSVTGADQNTIWRFFGQSFNRREPKWFAGSDMWSLLRHCVQHFIKSSLYLLHDCQFRDD